MSMVSRFKDLVRANLNDLISRAEDPEKSLNLYIDDATENLRQFSIEVNRFESERIVTANHLHTCEAIIQDWHSKAKLALQQSREDLAQKALESEQKEKTRLEHLQTELSDAEQISAQMKEQYQLLEEKLAEAKERRDDLVHRNRRAVVESKAANAITGINKEDPLSKFDRMGEKVERHEAEAQSSFSVMTSSTSYEMDQLKKVGVKSEVDAALAKLKQELQADSIE